MHETMTDITMGSVSTRLDDDVEEEIRETADRRDDSIAEVVRELIEKGQDYGRLKTENEQLRDEIERHKREKRKLIAKLEENDELVEYVNEEQRLLRKRERRERKREKRQEAPAWKRAKWWLFGRGDQSVITYDDMKKER